MTMTIKQKNLLERLMVEKGTELRLEGLSSLEASQQIQRLMRLPNVQRESVPAPAPVQPNQQVHEEQVTFDDIPGITFDSKPQKVEEPVERLITTGQLDTIKKLGDELNANMDMTVIGKYTVEQASETIKKLISVKQRQVGSGPTESQIELLQDMSISPAIDYENFLKLFNFSPKAIEKRSKLLARHRFLLKDASKSDEAKEVADRIVDANRFFDKAIQNYDLTTLDKKKVSDFIKDNMREFRIWKSSLATDAQINLIKDMIEQVNRLNGWIAKEEIITQLDGSVIESDVASDYLSDDTTDIFADWAEDDYQQLTKDCASDLINQLNIELLRLDETSTLDATVTRDAKRNIVSQQANNELERKRLINMIYSLEALCGTEPEVEDIEGSDVNKYILELIDIAVDLAGKGSVRNVLDYHNFEIEDVVLKAAVGSF